MNSFLPISAESDFPLQNLPYGVFRPRAGGPPRVGVAIGESVLDLSVLEARGLLQVPLAPGLVMNQPALNAFAALGRPAWRAVREQLAGLLSENEPTLRDDEQLRSEALVPQREVEMLLPMQIGDYTDFYSSRHHATNVGTMLRGAERALQENWLHLPVAYHGRASSIVLSGAEIRRPLGQTGPGQFGPSRALDFELEMGFFIGPGNEWGESISVAKAEEHIFGLVLVNDWSARDLQKWEYVPLGPFLAKNFATTISPWVVTLDALEPFRTAGPPQEPTPLSYLQVSGESAYDIELEVHLTPAAGKEPVRLAHSNFRHLYWSMAQQLAHHTVNGCNLRTGDLLASGTISGPEKSERGCLLELAWRGSEPIELPGGERRVFLEDGDEVTLTAWCQGDGYRIGFGAASGKIIPERG